MKSLSRLISPDRITRIDEDNKDDCLRSLVTCLSESESLGNEDSIFEAIMDRERLLSTGFGLGLAIPHAKLNIIDDFIVGLAIHRDGVPFDSLDEQPVHILVMILGPDQKQDEYLKVLSRVTAFLKDQREKILSLEDNEEIYKLTFDY
ncbi:MAG: PTS sugar transporter subunit IIA [Planctomycetota bacterium]|jgi:mannitol/fructose-specific phosphotransferase system IIA component (Ntr-type)|nr:PTS sugar transporter subunit IIA [Planctomycetota bacterium]HBO52615.1 PTS sugar transporter subunit IIA [Planctomycetota bacterium]|tara:strand:+ start:229 stop:672 length:444 start_codon:yes stop_codon:yes gene_type:complete